VRRAYFDCRFGQLHVRTAFPANGGFGERATLLCLHCAGASGRMFDAFLPAMATDRSVYAPDMPGCGESDPPPHPAVDGYALAMADFLDSMRFRQIDLLGCGEGALVAAALAKLRPELVRKRFDLPERDKELLGTQAEAIAKRAREFLS
jgi:pimeloyl-ACP methyl ester carboxylesterase